VAGLPGDWRVTHGNGEGWPDKAKVEILEIIAKRREL
jgi:hypothetical protein